MKDEDIFKRLKKETPLVKQKDLQPLSSKDFAPKRSAFDMLVEKTNERRAERRGGGNIGRPPYERPTARDRERAADGKPAGEQGGLSMHRDAVNPEQERVQRPVPRAIQARSETHIRMGSEPIRQTEVRTVSVQPRSPQRTEPERTQHTPSQSDRKPPLQEDARYSVRPETRNVQPSNPLRAEAQQAERPQKREYNPEVPAREYAEPARTRRSSIREAYTRAEASQLEIFSEAAQNRKPAIRADSLAMAPMRRQRTEFEEYYEPAQAREHQPAFRHELKFYINYTEYILLRNTLKALAQLDKYAGDSGEYHIRSLYFDDEFESALVEKMAGSDFRKKYRIRIYNLSDDVIKFEKKIKQGQFVTKKSISLSREEYEHIIAGQYEFLLRRKEPLASELFLELRNSRLRPRVIVDYIREAYVYPFGDVRITFDKDLRAGMWLTDIFDPDAPTMPMYDEGTMVLEVKFEKCLPAHIRGILNNIDTAQRSAISKYVICRKFE